jgi:phosphoglycerol transferase MdoB-like AlkP superfamily enzyme
MTGGGNTSDAEFLSNNSLYPLKEGSVYFRYPSNTYESIPNLLKKEGYSSYVFHANNPSFWNRTEMYRAVGFDRFFSNNDFTLDEQRGWGLGDKSMFRQGLEKIDTSKPFYSFFITLSSHHPFNYFDDYKGFDAGNYNSTFLGNYMKAAHYADEAIGGFISELKEKGLYDNSVLVIYGDHNAIQKEDDQIAALKNAFGFQFTELNWTKLQKVPCFIHFPGMKEFGTINKIGGQIDLLPTLANLMGLDAPFALGKDLLNSSESYAVLRPGTVITEDFVYNNSDNTVYNNAGVKQNKEDYAAKIAEYQKLLNISDLILSKDALKQLEKDKE